MGKGLPKLSDNWKVVALSLLVATIFWFFNALSKDYDARVEYPLEFHFQKDSLVVVDPLPEYIQLEVAGGGWELLRRTTWIGANPIIIKLDNPTEVKLYPKNNLRRIVSEQLKDITVKYILTDSVFINIEPRVSRSIIVKLDSISIGLEESHRLTSPITLSEDTVKITGPVSLIKKLVSPYYLKLGENEISRDYDEEIRIPLENERIMSSNPKSLDVTFKVEEYQEINLAIPLETINFDSLENIVLTDTSVQIKFWVAESKAKEIKASDFSFIVDRSLMNERDSTIEILTFYIPEDALDLTFEKEKVSIKTINE